MSTCFSNTKRRNTLHQTPLCGTFFSPCGDSNEKQQTSRFVLTAVNCSGELFAALQGRQRFTSVLLCPWSLSKPGSFTGFKVLLRSDQSGSNWTVFKVTEMSFKVKHFMCFFTFLNVFYSFKWAKLTGFKNIQTKCTFLTSADSYLSSHPLNWRPQKDVENILSCHFFFKVRTRKSAIQRAVAVKHCTCHFLL